MNEKIHSLLKIGSLNFPDETVVFCDVELSGLGSKSNTNYSEESPRLIGGGMGFSEVQILRGNSVLL